mgnify:CR=1 FL=1
MRERIALIIKKAVPKEDFEVSVPEKSEFGHYSTNAALRLAQTKGKNSKEVAGELVAKIERAAPKDFFEKIEIAGPGFINFWIEKSVFQKELLAIHKKKDFGKSERGMGKKVIVEYSSPNIAKPMHVGHLRSTVIGDALANIHEFLGYKVIRWNYLGDWGTQFGQLIAAYKLWGKKSEIQASPVKTLEKLYVRFHKEMKSRPDLEDMGREEFRKLEEGDRENRRLWEWFRSESLKEFARIYKRLGVKFNVSIGESFYEKDLRPIIERLLRRGIAKESEGALIVDLEKEGLPPALIRKSDGATLYITRDLANLEYRIKKYKPAKILYVVANEQSLHFEQLFAIAKILGLKSSELHHVKFGLVLGSDRQKFSTREGKTVALEELIEKLIKLAHDIVLAKNPKLKAKDKKMIAEAVGLGALKYNDLREHRHSDVIFDWKKMLDISGDSAPYLEYSYARLEGIKKKVRSSEGPDVSLLVAESELALIHKILEFPCVIEASADQLITNNLAKFLYELAALSNKFYETTPVAKAENAKLKAGRLLLIDMVARVLKRGLGLLGIKTPSRL